MIKCRKRFLIITALVLAVIGIAVYAFSHKTYYKYNDWEIVGKDINTIEQKYGTFDLVVSQTNNQGGMVAYFAYTDNSNIMPSYMDYFYYMYYDENQIVYKVEVKGQPEG